MSLYNFKKIQVVPNADEFLDIVLSKTQRKTATVVHKNYSIGRIRTFYMRKVKFTQDSFEEKLKLMLDDFPMLDNIHPFYSDLMNVLYDKDHYKLALGQINTARHLINAVAKDYVRLLKFGDSLYRCKQLKRAALGRMGTIMKRQKDSLAYLEQVRQHLSRLPSIDPNTRTLVICGYPNVGKSSFLNKVSRADVDVQPYAFTTKSLFVGHMDYKYLRWQVIDTPGILDHPLEEMNTIEMQSITALAHLRACIMFFMDLSEQCGYSVADQCKLYHNIKPLFANKPTILVINKIDICRPEDLKESDQALLQEIINSDSVTMVQTSCYTEEGVMDVRNAACDKLLSSRVEMKMKGQKINDVLNKLHLTKPAQRDDISRPVIIPDGARTKTKFDLNDPDRRKLERDIEAENGGAGVYNVDLKKVYDLANDEWKYDTIPEILDGKNVADFVDPDIAEKLDALEREEERLEAEGFYNSDEEMVNSEDEAIKEAAGAIKERRHIMTLNSRHKKIRNRPILPIKAHARSSTASDMQEHLSSMGIDSSEIRSRSQTRKRSRSESRATSSTREGSQGPAGRSSSMVRDRSTMGLRNVKQKLNAVKIQKKSQRTNNLLAKRGEADRDILTKMPKHLFAGKRGMGKTDRR